MEIERPSLPSGSPVKQLTTSKPKGNMSTEDSISPNLRKHGRVLGTHQVHQRPTQQQQRKQVKRRPHTNRPHRERFLKMAEERREILTALKYHRAAMKQASKEQQQHHLSNFEQDERFKSRTNPKIYPSCTTNFSNHMDDFSYSYSFSHAPPSIPNFHTPITSQLPHPTHLAENPNFTLPNDTLGLNRSLHNVNNLKATLFLNNNNNNSSLSSSSPSPVLTDQKVPSIEISQGEGVSSVVDTIESTNGGLHIAMDDEGMAEIKALGEQYQMEWNDTMSLVTSAWWFNFLKNMENGVHQVNNNEDVAYHYIFDELMEFPALLHNANESCLEQCSEECFQDPMTLPW